MKQQGRTGSRYMFEHGAPYTPPPATPPFIPDRNFDGDSIYGLPEIEMVGLAEVAPSSSPLVPSANEPLDRELIDRS
ncbi:hypothetical protein [Bradyrhizobium sp.]|uniref:hypothetical protein n=1 Tax=Bradyrhizobium sp. TaxID=376 RepID=UPI001EBB68FB|nr:hypothetical protein [Bradyrhizobium sp.]MBV8893168.1 hypothetical protein [Acidobacteriota bacterium]MBV8916554.1 hypothetical protein [Bradyrhizobium sp.]MBV9982410.1 hypothetical protein [Bradyrhizobium sp.]